MGQDERDSKVRDIAVFGLMYFLAIALTEMVAWEITKNYVLGYQLLAGFLLVVAAGGFLVWVYSKITPRLTVSSESNSDIQETSRIQRNPSKLRRLFGLFFWVSFLIAGLGILFLAEPAYHTTSRLVVINQTTLSGYVDSPYFTIGSVLASIGFSAMIFYASQYLSDSQNDSN